MHAQVSAMSDPLSYCTFITQTTSTVDVVLHRSGKVEAVRPSWIYILTRASFKEVSPLQFDKNVFRLLIRK